MTCKTHHPHGGPTLRPPLVPDTTGTISVIIIIIMVLLDNNVADRCILYCLLRETYCCLSDLSPLEVTVLQRPLSSLHGSLSLPNSLHCVQWIILPSSSYISCESQHLIDVSALMLLILHHEVDVCVSGLGSRVSFYGIMIALFDLSFKNQDILILLFDVTESDNKYVKGLC